jgi:hypothetical protein
MPTIKDPNKFKIKNSKDDNNTLSDNPELDFVRKIQFCSEGSELIQKRFQSTTETQYPATGLVKLRMDRSFN